MKYISRVGMPNDKFALFNIMAFHRWANWINIFDIGEIMNKLKSITYIVQNLGVFFIVLGIFPIMPDKLTDIGIVIGGFALLMRCIKFRERPEFFKIKSWWPIMGPLSRPRSKILRVAVSRIILSSEASKVKLVGNLVA